LYNSAKSIVEHYIKGTLYNIKMDDDGLIAAGDENTQLTWMDEKVGDVVITPRSGKTVEINALWYNGLRIMDFLQEKFEKTAEGHYGQLAEKVKDSYIKTFWNEEDQCLYDYVSGNYKNTDIRPNQIFAVSLSYPVIQGELAAKIIDKVLRELYTPYGLRSLSDKSPKYKGIYTGDQYNRDSAYHQGTVWTWPLGHFISALRKVYGKNETYMELVHNLIKPFEEHLRDGCAENISEIFDGDHPHRPKGCVAQAWSVAEILRVYCEGR